MKLFDCHCHAQLGPRGIAPLLETIPQSLSASSVAVLHEHNGDVSHLLHNNAASSASFAGAAIMSTHPRDYSIVDSAVSDLRDRSYRAVPCYGIHPWFLHEVLHESDYDDSNSFDANDGSEEWLVDLKQRLVDHPDSIVGEIGLDGARWREVEETYDNTDEGGKNDNITIWDKKRVLSCPMKHQRRAFEQQLLLAAELQRPVSIHVVKAWGELFDSFDTVRNTMKNKYLAEEKHALETATDDDTLLSSNRRKKPKRLLLPPKIYFHAFSGKEGIIPSILAACEKGNVPREDVFFGFAPAIPNYYSAKTPSIMKRIGIRQLVLETDLEDMSNAWDDLKRGVEGLATALDMDACEVAEQAYENAERLYFGRK